MIDKLPIDPKLPINADIQSLRKHIYELHRMYAKIINHLVEKVNTL